MKRILIVVSFLNFVFASNIYGQFIAKSKSCNLDYNDANFLEKLPSYLDDLTASGFKKLIDDSCIKKVNKRTIISSSKSYSVIEIELCSQKGNIYSERVYVIKESQQSYYYYINCDTLFYPSNVFDQFVLLVNVRGQIFSQQFRILKGNLKSKNEILLFKNDECLTFRTNQSIEKYKTSSGKASLNFRVFNECTSKSSLITRIIK